MNGLDNSFLGNMLTIKEPNRQRGIWVVDQRQEFFNIDDDRMRRKPLSVRAVCMKTDLKKICDGYRCQGERFYDQMVAANSMCTGVLVDTDVVVAILFSDETNKMSHELLGIYNKRR